MNMKDLKAVFDLFGDVKWDFERIPVVVKDETGQEHSVTGIDIQWEERMTKCRIVLTTPATMGMVAHIGSLEITVDPDVRDWTVTNEEWPSVKNGCVQVSRNGLDSVMHVAFLLEGKKIGGALPVGSLFMFTSHVEWLDATSAKTVDALAWALAEKVTTYMQEPKA